MAVITLDQVKTYTSLIDSHDKYINAMIPVIDAKVKEITRQDWNKQIIGKVVSGSPYVEVYSIFIDNRYQDVRGINSDGRIDNLKTFLNSGTQINGTALASESYISAVYSNGDSVELNGTRYNVPVIQLNQNAIESDSNAELFLNISIAYLPVIAKGVQWLIDQNASSKMPGSGVKSTGIGPASVTFSDQAVELDGISGMPTWFVKGLPRYQRGF
jgi:hypothetical protein